MTPDDAEPAAPTRAARLALCGCLLGLFMQMLDTTVVNVALPDLTVDIGASTAQQLLVLSVYTLAFACTLLTAATIGGIFGRRRLFLLSLVVFTVASVLCGLARSPLELIVFRGAQGIGAALMSAQTLALIAALFAKRHHGRVFGLYGAVAGVAAMLGPLIGGLLVEVDLFGWGWRAVFFVNVPIAVGAFVFAAGRLPRLRDPGADSPDLVGVVLSTAGLFALLYPLSVGREQDWPASLWLMTAGAVALLTLFVLHERRLLRRGGSPLLRVDLFASRQFSVGLLLSLLFFSLFAGFFFAISLTLQSGLGHSALKTGVLALPLAAGAVVGTLSSNTLAGRIGGARTLSCGAVLVGAAFAWFAAVLEPADAALDVPASLPPLVLGGVGIGVFIAPLQTAILSRTGPENVGSASGCVPTVQQIGHSLGLTLVGVFFFGAVAAHAGGAVDGTRPVLEESLHQTSIDPMFTGAVIDRFAYCAQTRLASAHPDRPVPGCSADSAARSGLGVGIADEAAPAVRTAARRVAAIAFLGGLRSTLWVLAGLALVVALASPALRPGPDEPVRRIPWRTGDARRAPPVAVD
ncbi:MAG: MFS transporter [Gordonia sp. (in: high G+C Gram-positive bacteria)]|uniref:MFS transporter n=1 Tax=Gordonia sp. (in: high G+C Gram-positive bacteria) TaxID=84139 RepID=UPI0039E3A4EB